MFRAYVENEKKEKIELSNSPYWYVRIEGMLPGKAALHTTTLVNNDGSVLNNARKEDREITITVKPKLPVAQNRQRLYKYFKTKKKITIFYETDNRDVKTEGYIESIDGSLFEQTQEIEIVVKCVKPYFEDRQGKIIDMSQVLDMFEFPFDVSKDGIEFSVIDKTLTQNVFNAGDTETGFVIELTAIGRVVNPIIYNTETRKRFGLNTEMQLGDVIEINTNVLKKSVTLTRYGERRNIINAITKGNEWFKLTPGENVFTYQCEDGEENLQIRFIYSNKYEGV